MISFAAYTAAETPKAFQWAVQSPKVPIPVAGSRPCLIHGFLGPHESASQGHLDLFSHIFAHLIV